MRTYSLVLFCVLTILASSCIGDDILDDFVEPVVRITNPIDTLEVGTSIQFSAMFFNNVGREETATVSWSSLDPGIIQVGADGVANALTEGATEVIARVTFDGNSYEDRFPLVAGAATTAAVSERPGVIMTTTFYTLEGDFVMRTMEDNGVRIEVADNYVASNSLPGLYLYLTNNPNSTAGALEIGEVTVFSGAHTYEIPDVEIKEYEYLLYFCKPFSVKVGEGNFND